MSLKILVADDEASQREIMKAFLVHLGHSVLLAADGEEAVQMAQESRPDAVFLDMVMPRMNGLDACRTLKINSETKDVKVVMLTAIVQQSVVKLAKQNGADAYLAKPIGLQDLGGILNILFKSVVKTPAGQRS